MTKFMVAVKFTYSDKSFSSRVIEVEEKEICYLDKNSTRFYGKNINSNTYAGVYLNDTFGVYLNDTFGVYLNDTFKEYLYDLDYFSIPEYKK